MKPARIKTQSVGAFEAKTNLSRYLADAERGVVTVVTKRGRVTAKIVPPDAEVSLPEDSSDLETLLGRARVLRAKTRPGSDTASALVRATRR
jgi:antitoxin (DNA-binding transcriptional repressor) of toxin-antitoxin stability system